MFSRQFKNEIVLQPSFDIRGYSLVFSGSKGFLVFGDRCLVTPKFCFYSLSDQSSGCILGEGVDWEGAAKVLERCTLPENYPPWN